MELTTVSNPKALLRAAYRRLRRRLNPPVKAAAADVFDVWADDGRDLQMERAHSPVARKMFEQLLLEPDWWYLDLGCGNGYTVRWAAERLPSGRAVGIDASRHMIDRARELSRSYPQAHFAECVFPDHELPHDSFDVVFSLETLYYMSDLQAALREIRRLLKPGGTLVSAIDYFWENEESRSWSGYVGTDMQLLSARRWRREFKRAGFENVRQEQIVIPSREALEPWHATVGSLLTCGSRPA